MTVDNQPRIQRIEACRQIPIETAWDTLDGGQRERALRAVIMVCCQIASAQQKPNQKTIQKGTTPSTEEVRDEQF